MKMLFAFLVTLFAMAAQAQTQVYNECKRVGKLNEGIYFENGYRRPSVNASRHYYEEINLVLETGRDYFMIGGDDLYRARCKELASGPTNVSLSRRYYEKFDKTYNCDGEAHLHVKFDLAAGSSTNGHITVRYKNGATVDFDLACGK